MDYTTKVEKEKTKYCVVLFLMGFLFLVLCCSLWLVCWNGRSIISFIKLKLPCLQSSLESLRGVVTGEAIFKLGEALGIGSILLVWIYNSLDKKEMGTLYSELLEEICPRYYIFVLIHLGSFGVCLWMAKAEKIATASLALLILVIGSFLQCRILKRFVLSPENRKQIALHRWEGLVYQKEKEEGEKEEERLRELIYSMATAVVLDAGSHCEELLEIIVKAIQRYIEVRDPKSSEDWKWVLLDIAGFWNDILGKRSANDQTVILRKIIRSCSVVGTKEALCIGYVLWRYDWRIRKTDYEMKLQRPIEALASEVAILTERTFARGNDSDEIFYCFQAAFCMLIKIHTEQETIDGGNEFSKLIPQGEEDTLKKTLLYGFAQAVFSKDVCDKSRELKRYQRVEQTLMGSCPQRPEETTEKVEARLYAVVLESISELRAKCFEEGECFSKSEEVWIAMGHFDAMHTYEVSVEEGLFQAIERNNKVIFDHQKNGRYYHPLYLISTEGDKLGSIWQNPFMAVARIHFSENVDSEKTYEDLSRKLKEKANASKYECQIFRTVELSDMIMAVSARNLCGVLKFTLAIREYHSIGKVYTHVGVNYNAVKKGIAPEENDKIDLFSMRFSVLNFEEINDCVNAVKNELGEENCYSVAGVDDIMLNWKDLETSRLAKLYRKWFVDKLEPMENRSFAEVTTRVGTYQMENTEKAEEGQAVVNSRELLMARCKSLLELSQIAQRKYSELSWVAPLSVLSNTLMRISGNPVLDEFVYIMYEGIDAFLQNMVKKNIQEAEPYQEFVENGIHLMEHVIRVEGQLSHNPEVRPVVYDIPVAMLEYTLAFLKQVSGFLQGADGDEKAENCFLLVPRLCERIMAQELFQAEPGKLPGLVLVTIPVGLLYNAKEIQMALCHEASHFVGERCRDREERRKKYVQSVACLMARVMFQYEESYVEVIQHALLEKTENMQAPRMRDMQRQVLEWVSELWTDGTAMSRFADEVRRSGNEEVDLEKKLRGAFNEENLAKFEDLLGDIGNLFREVYADLCMLHILEISSKTYVGSMIEELNKNREEDRRYEAIAIRVYAALAGTGKEIPSQFIKKESPGLYREMERFRDLGSRKENFKGMFPLCTVLFLTLYAKKCYEHLCNLKGKERIKETFSNAIDKKMDYKSFLDNIDWYRKGVLGIIEA